MPSTQRVTTHGAPSTPRSLLLSPWDLSSEQPSRKAQGARPKRQKLRGVGDRRPVPGRVCLGGGVHRGLGLVTIRDEHLPLRRLREGQEHLSNGNERGNGVEYRKIGVQRDRNLTSPREVTETQRF